MKNLLLALAGTLMLSTATNAQQLYFYDSWGSADNFDIVVTDVTDDQVTFDMFNPNGSYFWTAVYHGNLDMFTGHWMEYYFMTNQNMGQYYNNNDYSMGFNDVDGTIAYLISLIAECPADLTSSVDSLQALLDAANAQIAQLENYNSVLLNNELVVAQQNSLLTSQNNALLEENADLLALNDSLVDAQNCDYELFVIDELLLVNTELQNDLVECDSVAIAEVDYWMNNYYDAVAEGNSLVDSLQNQLDIASAAAAACPTAIQEAVDNALATCQGDAEAAWNDGYDYGVEVTTDALQAECLELMTENYEAGYAEGLEDCEGEVSGLVDIDGTIVPVIGYYNELGQVINPNTTDGIIIRRHADGTFSKYIKTLR